MSDPRSRIPSVDRLLATDGAEALIEAFGRPRVVAALREAVDDVRAGVGPALGSGPVDRSVDGAAPASDAGDLEAPGTYVELARAILHEANVPSLRPVINATGVVLHTNLGRAPLAEAAVEAMQRAARGYTNLELDLEEGARGSRYVHCVSLLQELTGAEDALVVNNAAAALVLALNTVGLGRGIVVSRGELVEIGGGFRIPEVLERAGARLLEVGSTNRTRTRDYAEALDDPSACAILKVHRSNFRITGFTEEAAIAELVALAQERGVPLVHDLGSGLLIDAAELGLPAEPRAQESIEAGADVVVVSGDKLLGGPQAGIAVGRADVISRMRENPLCRALRVDKMTLAALEATLRLYRDPARAKSQIPTLAMLTLDSDALERTARDVAAVLTEALGAEDSAEGGLAVDVVQTAGAVGGGTYPGVELESWAVALRAPTGAERLANELRSGDPPVAGRIVDDTVLLDVRTVHPRELEALVRRVAEVSRG